MTPDQWRQIHPKPEFKVTLGNILWFQPDNLAKDYIDNYVPLRPVSPIVSNEQGEAKPTKLLLLRESFSLRHGRTL